MMQKQLLQQRFIPFIGMLIVLVVTLVAARQAEQRVVRRIAAGTPVSEANDFDRWMQILPRFLSGEEGYVNDRFPTPPITIALFSPLTLVSPPTAQFIWACCKPLLAGVIFWCCRELALGAGVRLSTAAVGLIFAAWLWPMIGDMQEGQTNLLMLAPLALGLWMAQRENAKWDAAAGVLIGLAVCIKVTPAIFILYFLWRRRWRIAIWSLCGMALFLVILPSLFFGVQRNVVLLVGWFQVMIVPYVMQGEVVYANGESLGSMMTRFLQHVPAFRLSRGEGMLPFYVNVVDMPAWAVQWIVRGMLAAILCAGLVWMRRALFTLRCQRYVGEVGVVAAFMLLASERTWVAHYVSLVVPMGAVGMVASYPWYPAHVRKLAYGALVFAAVMMLLTSDVAKWVFGVNGRELAMTFNVPLVASTALVGLLMWARLPDRPMLLGEEEEGVGAVDGVVAV